MVEEGEESITHECGSNVAFHIKRCLALITGGLIILGVHSSINTYDSVVAQSPTPEPNGTTLLIGENFSNQRVDYFTLDEQNRQKKISEIPTSPTEKVSNDTLNLFVVRFQIAGKTNPPPPKGELQSLLEDSSLDMPSVEEYFSSVLHVSNVKVEYYPYEITLEANTLQCESNIHLQAVLQHLRGDGYDTTSIDRILLIQGYDASCPYEALAILYTSPSQPLYTWLNFPPSMPIKRQKYFVLHELMHNEGLNHANRLTISSSGEIHPQEYGDSTSVLGSTPLLNTVHLNGPNLLNVNREVFSTTDVIALNEHFTAEFPVQITFLEHSSPISTNARITYLCFNDDRLIPQLQKLIPSCLSISYRENKNLGNIADIPEALTGGLSAHFFAPDNSLHWDTFQTPIFFPDGTYTYNLKPCTSGKIEFLDPPLHITALPIDGELESIGVIISEEPTDYSSYCPTIYIPIIVNN